MLALINVTLPRVKTQINVAPRTRCELVLKVFEVTGDDSEKVTGFGKWIMPLSPVPPTPTSFLCHQITVR